MRVRLRVKGRFLSFISCYVPTFRCSDEEQETFYEALVKMVDVLPRKDELVISGDFNARVGLASDRPSDDSPTVHELVGSRSVMPTVSGF